MHAGLRARPEQVARDQGGVYAVALGAAWSQLDPAVAELHGAGTDTSAVGRFTVRRGRGSLVRLLAWVLRLPRSGVDVPLQLRIDRRPASETWHRRFAGQHCLHSSQRALGANLIEEQVGIARLVLAVSADGVALRVRQVGAGIRLGGLHVPLPLRSCPRTGARVTPAGRGGVAVSVRVTLPRGRLLVAYSGVVEEVSRR